MTMPAPNQDITQVIKWQQNNAPKIQALINQKADWYKTNCGDFWDDWYAGVFNLKTATPFGLMVWSIILGMNARGFGLYPKDRSWAYGPLRQNYASPNVPTPAGESVGGNFYGGGSAEILSFVEIRQILQLRYFALISNCSIAQINHMLRYIFNDGQPWDNLSKKYFYVADIAIATEPRITDHIVWKQDWQGLWRARTGPRTNFAKYSTPTADGQWLPRTPNSMKDATITYGAAAAPEPGKLAVKINRPADSDSSMVCFRMANLNALAAGNISIFAKRASGTSARYLALTCWYNLGRIDLTVDLTNRTKKGGFVVTCNSPITIADFYVIPLADGWLRIVVAATGMEQAWNKISVVGVNNPFDKTDTVTTGATECLVYGAQYDNSALLGGYIPTEAASPQVTDYTYVSSLGGNITINPAPPVGQILYWSGNWKGGVIPADSPRRFATGDGSTTAFVLNAPANIALPVAKAFQLEYRIGANLNLSAQLVNLISDPASGVLPAPIGCSVTVKKES